MKCGMPLGPQDWDDVKTSPVMAGKRDGVYGCLWHWAYHDSD